MQKRYLVLAAFGAGGVWAVAGPVAPVKTNIEFTKAALPPPTNVEIRAVASTSHVVLPVELGPLAARAEQSLPENLALIHDYLPDAACGQRKTGYECANAKLEGTISRSGPVSLKVAPALIKLSIPVKYALTATGNAWARDLVEQKAGDGVVDLQFAIEVNPAGGLDVTKRELAPADDLSVGLLKANVRLSHLLEAQLRPVARAAEDDLRRALAILPIKVAVAHAWDALAQPLELGHGSGLWLKGAPDFYTAGAFVSVGDRLTYQVPIASHLAIVETDHGATNNVRRVATISQDIVPTGPSRVRVAVPVDLETMRQQAEIAFGHGQEFESRVDRFSDPVKVKVRATRVYPALREIGLELDVDVTTSKGVTTSGKLNLAGRPVLDANAGTVTLADVTFPPVSSKDSGGRLPGVPRLGTEPFATKFAAIAKLDISHVLAEALPRAKQMLNQQIGTDLQLQARLVEATPVSLEFARDGAWLMVDLTGDVALAYNGAMDPVEIPILKPIGEGDPKTTTPATLSAAKQDPKLATPGFPVAPKPTTTTHATNTKKRSETKRAEHKPTTVRVTQAQHAPRYVQQSAAQQTSGFHF